MASPLHILVLLVTLSIAAKDKSSSPGVICHFSPKNGTRITEGKRGTVSLTCANRMFDLNQTIVIISLDPTTDGETLSLCQQKGNTCHMNNKPIMLYMTSRKATFNLQVTAKKYGIRCLKQTSVYQRGSMIFPSSMSMDDLELIYNMSGQETISLDEPLQMDIPDEYTEVYVIKQESPKNVTDKHEFAETNTEARMKTAEHILFVDLIKTEKDIHFKILDNSRPGNWHQYIVYTSENTTDLDEEGFVVSHILTMLGLCAGNFMIGTLIDYQVIKSLGEEVMSSYRQCNCFSRLISLRAWKVGLFCQLFFPSILSFALSKLIFTDTSMPCNMVMDLSRLGLFLLGTAPSNTAATYFSALWNGDLNLSVGLVILSTIVSPLSTLFWWATLGKVLLSSSQTDILTVPALLILEFLGVMVVPVFIGIGLAGILPCIKGFMQWIRRPVLVVGMLLYIGIYYYQYKNFLDIFSTSHLVACASLALGSAFLSCITAFFCNLNTSQIISIVIDCTMQNATLSYAVVAGSLKEPEVQYASSPANAQVLFTSIPIMVVWFMYYGGRKLKSRVMKKDVSDKVQVASAPSQSQAYRVGEEEKEDSYKMCEVGKIKEAWTGQEQLRYLWV